MTIYSCWNPFFSALSLLIWTSWSAKLKTCLCVMCLHVHSLKGYHIRRLTRQKLLLTTVPSYVSFDMAWDRLQATSDSRVASRFHTATLLPHVSTLYKLSVSASADLWYTNKSAEADSAAIQLRMLFVVIAPHSPAWFDGLQVLLPPRAQPLPQPSPPQHLRLPHRQ